MFFSCTEHFKYYLGKEYKDEITLLLEKETSKNKIQIDNLFKEIKNEKDPYKKQANIEYGIENIFFDFYWKLIDTTEKYTGKNKIKNNLAAGDNVWEMHKVLIPYFKNNKINTSTLLSFINYGLEKQKIIEKTFTNQN